jgi:hypothetical protein
MATKPAPQAAAAPAAPANRPHGKLEDVREHFAQLTAKQPVDQKFRAAFLQNKILVAHTHPMLNLAARDLMVKGLVDRIGPDASAALNKFGLQGAVPTSPPVPGGVGYGMFYTAAYKASWGHGTSFATDFVCPTPPGGNVNTFLYLTATNRSGMGVEAFVSYNGQNDTHFRVFDWSRSDHWQTDAPFGSLGNYLTTVSAHGHPYQVLPVWNSTWLLSGSTYRNQALLYNHVRGGWDLFYQNDYTATDEQQKTVWVGSWGPIVETFQPAYNHTNQMGALATQLISADNNGHWASWALLSGSNATVRTDNVGFHQVFVDPNYAFTVNS